MALKLLTKFFIRLITTCDNLKNYVSQHDILSLRTKLVPAAGRKNAENVLHGKIMNLKIEIVFIEVGTTTLSVNDIFKLYLS